MNFFSQWYYAANGVYAIRKLCSRTLCILNPETFKTAFVFPCFKKDVTLLRHARKRLTKMIGLDIDPNPFVQKY